MKIIKLDRRGFSHDIVLVATVAIFAIIGVGFLVSSHAASAAPSLGINTANCTNGLSGWASTGLGTGANGSLPVTIIVWANGPAGDAGANATLVGDTTNHGNGSAVNPNWTMPIPPSLAGSPHSFYIYAVSGSGSSAVTTSPGSTNVYGSDPITSSACSSPGPSGQVDVSAPYTVTPAPALLGINTANCSYGLSGWAAANLSGSSTPITLWAFADAPWQSGGIYVGQTTSGAVYPPNNPNWSISIPASLSGGSHSFYIYAINNSGGTDYSITGPSLTGSGSIYGSDPISSTACNTAIDTPKATVAPSGGGAKSNSKNGIGGPSATAGPETPATSQPSAMTNGIGGPSATGGPTIPAAQVGGAKPTSLICKVAPVRWVYSFVYSVITHKKTCVPQAKIITTVNNHI